MIDSDFAQCIAANIFMGCVIVFFLIFDSVTAWLATHAGRPRDGTSHVSHPSVRPTVLRAEAKSINDNSDASAENTGDLFYAMFDAIFNNSADEDSENAWLLNSYQDISAKKMRNRGYRPKHPVVVVPGLFSSELVAENPPTCAESVRGKSVFGANMTNASNVKLLIRHFQCWLEMLQLDPETGLDPVMNATTGEKVRVRVKDSPDAADTFIRGVYLMSKMKQNLLRFGYAKDDIRVMPYDWRLSPPLLEIRDGYLTRMKHVIEELHDRTDQKVLVVTHSMGSTTFHYFLHWVNEQDSTWLTKYVHAFNPIAGPFLGDPKLVASMITVSGYLQDHTPPLIARILKNIGHEVCLACTLRTWRSLSSMIPMGGRHIFPDPLIEIHTPAGSHNMTIGDSMRLLQHQASHDQISEYLRIAFGTARSPLSYLNPLLRKLPAGLKRIVCMTGVGLNTDVQFKFDLKGNKYFRSPNRADHPITFANGDGTVPAISSGYLCAKGWTDGSWRNQGTKVVMKEYENKPWESWRWNGFLGGPLAASHKALLGNDEVISDILMLAAGYEVDQEIHSNILELAADAKIRLHDESEEEFFSAQGHPRTSASVA